MKKYILLIVSFLFITACSSDEPSSITSTETTEKTILALGDSLTAGYGLPASDSYPSQLEAKLRDEGYRYSLVNAGISGDTTAGVVSRLDWVLEGGAPALVILCIGANDAFQGKDVSEIEANLRQIIEKIQSKKIPILFAGMKAPLNLGGEYGRKYEAIFPKLAKEYDLVFMPFFLQGIALKGSLNLDDRIHPNRAGYALLVENLFAILEDEKLIAK